MIFEPLVVICLLACVVCSVCAFLVGADYGRATAAVALRKEVDGVREALRSAYRFPSSPDSPR